MPGDTRQPVERHYGVNALLDSSLQALAAAGKDIERLMPADLATVDEFHIRGREATLELAGRAGANPPTVFLHACNGFRSNAIRPVVAGRLKQPEFRGKSYPQRWLRGVGPCFRTPVSPYPSAACPHHRTAAGNPG